MLMKPIKQPSSKQPNKFQAFANKLGPLVYNGLIKRGYTKRSTYDNVMSQLAFESTYGTSPLALRAHNYGGYGYNGKDYNVYKDDAAFIDAYLNDMAGKYKKALNADTVADYAKELKRIGYFEAPLDQYTKNLIGMQSVRKAAAVHYGQPIVQQKPALMAVQLPKSFVPQETAQTIEESAQNAFKQPVLPPVGRGPEPEIEVPQEQASPFIFQHFIDLPPIEQTMGALLNDQPMVNLPGYKGGKDDESLRYFAKGAKNAGFVGQDQSGNNYNVDWDTIQRRGNKIYAVVSNGKNKGLSDITQATTDVGQYESPFILDDVLVTAPRLQKNTSKSKVIDMSNVQPRMLQNTSSPTYAKDQAKAKTGDIDKVMLGTLGLGIAPIAAQAAPAALAPGGAFWSNPMTQGIAASSLGAQAVNTASNAVMHKDWSTAMSDAIQNSTGYRPSESITEFTNPGMWLGMNGAKINFSGNPVQQIKDIYNIGKLATDYSKNFGKAAYREYIGSNIKKIGKYINAPSRMQRLSEKAKQYSDYFENLQYKTDNKISKYIDLVYNRKNRFYEIPHNEYGGVIPVEKLQLYGKDGILKSYERSKQLSDKTLRLNLEKYKDDFQQAFDQLQYKDGQLGYYDKDMYDPNQYVKTGHFEIPDFKTDRTISGDVKLNPYIERYKFKTATGNEIDMTPTTPEIRQPESDVNKLRQVLRDNIGYVKQQIPGFKEFGSASGVSDGGLTHITHDIDGYLTKGQFDEFAKSHKVSTKSEGNTYVYHVGGDDGLGVDSPRNIDINIISTKDGYAQNSRTKEMYKQFFPDEYHKVVSQIKTGKLKYGPNGELPILDINGKPLTSEQVFDKYDPLQKTIMDSLEIDPSKAGKEKHAGRFIEYLSGDNQQAVHNALLAHAKMKVGSQARLLPKMEFGTKEENIKLLKEIGLSGHLDDIASNNSKMQNALDYWYLTNGGIFQRNISNKVNPDKYLSPEVMRKAFREWSAETKGGSGAGFGLNTTVGGISGFNDNTPTSVAGWIQPKVKGLYDIKNAKEVVDLVKRINGDSQRIMTNDEIDLFNNLTKQRIPHDVTVRDVLQRSYNTPDRVKQQLQQFSDQTGINAFQGNVYNRRNKYGGIIRDLNDPEDLVGITESGASNFFGGPSFLERMNIIKSINNSGSRSPLDQVINNISRKRSYNILPEHVQSVRNKLDNQLNTYRELHSKNYLRNSGYSAKRYTIVENRNKLKRYAAAAGILGAGASAIPFIKGYGSDKKQEAESRHAKVKNTQKKLRK